MIWLEVVSVTAIALAVIFLPGGLAAPAAGARRLLLALAAPAVIISLLAAGAIAFGKLGVPWTELPITARNEGPPRAAA